MTDTRTVVPVLEADESLVAEGYDAPDSATVMLNVMGGSKLLMPRLDTAGAIILRDALTAAIESRQAQEAELARQEAARVANRPLEVGDVVILKNDTSIRPARRTVIAVNNNLRTGDGIDMVTIDRRGARYLEGKILRNLSAQLFRRLTDEEAATYDA